jgi:hypothetical protein
VPFWGKERRQRKLEVEQARAQAESALPAGWRLRGTDREGFQWFDEPTRIVRAWAALAEGPNGERAAAVALTEAEAYRQLARRLRGELEVTLGWAPPDEGVEDYY